VDWFPEKLAWSMTTPKNVVRKFPPFASFQKFLVSETSVGNISRQEIVSMIPPLLMDVRPGMTCLDMCAAPGSKSAQLIEMVHGGEEARVRKVIHEVAKEQNREASPDGTEVELEIKAESAPEEDNSDDGRATGLLVANDVEYRRAQMLVHQVKRLNSPNIVVTNHDASQFPSIRITSDNEQPKYLKFDRILADVPCSGDGTCRKNPNIWKDWIPGNGLGLHNIQVRILVRSLQMLKVGGRVVYSTCSMNPVENEAVVSAAISRCGGLAKVSIVDCSKDLPGLKRAPGFKQWKIMDKSGRIFSAWKEVKEAKILGTEDYVRLTETMFPYADLEESEVPPFERCLRLYPHMQDTGGFFVCVLEKQSEIRAIPEAKKVQRVKREREADGDSENASTKKAKTEENGDEAMADATTKEDPTDLLLSHLNGTVENGAETGIVTEDTKTEKTPAEDTKKEEAGTKFEEPADIQNEDTEDIEETTVETPRNGRGPNLKKSNQIHEEPYKYLPPDHPELLKIYEFYQIAERFPKDRFMVRNATGEPVKAIYYTSTHVRDILNENEGRGMKFVQAGVKMFMKQDAQGQDICRWRIQSEGLSILEPWVGEDRIVRLYKRSTLKKLLIEMFPKLSGGAWEEMGEIGERVRDIGMGCCVLRVETSDAEDGFK
jgi:multisite-specific tRNA:(cytosine-C5)-methyltransferase